MNKTTLARLTEEAMSETRNALRTLYDALNQGQQKKVLRDEEVVKLFERYKVLDDE